MGTTENLHRLNHQDFSECALCKHPILTLAQGGWAARDCSCSVLRGACCGTGVFANILSAHPKI